MLWSILFLFIVIFFIVSLYKTQKYFQLYNVVFLRALLDLLKSRDTLACPFVKGQLLHNLLGSPRELPKRRQVRRSIILKFSQVNILVNT